MLKKILISISLLVGGLFKTSDQQNFNVMDINVPMPIISEEAVNINKDVVIDLKDIDKGYIVIGIPENQNNKYKVKISSITQKSFYAISPGIFAYPLSFGAGPYEITIFERIEGKIHKKIFETTFESETDQTSPFEIPNFVIQYDENSKVTLLSQRLCSGISEDSKKISKIFRWVSNNIKYDYIKAEKDIVNYVPNLDEVVESEKGICLDYACLMSALLRIQGIPTKVVIGTFEGDPHAWVDVWMGDRWVSMDPTLSDKNIINDVNYIPEKYQ